MPDGYVLAPTGAGDEVAVLPGPRLLAGVLAGPGLDAHRRSWDAPRSPGASALVAATRAARIRGRGGAGFPFARKLTTALESGRKREVVVNAAEGEPASAKDAALMTAVPHLVLDGAEVVARALKVKTVRLVLPGDRPAVGRAVRAAAAERDGVRYELHTTTSGFVGGQRRAVIELIEGRENLPVTAWRPEAEAGLHGRPTVIANAETFAQVAALAALGQGTYGRIGTAHEPGTTLLTVAGDGPGGVVTEVPLGEPLGLVLHRCGYPPESAVLIGGYHGAWLGTREAGRRRLSREDLGTVGADLGAGVLLPLDPRACPVRLTAGIIDYLADQGARRCGPCTRGLPALAAACLDLGSGGGLTAGSRLTRLTTLVEGRGACAHPDGAVRLVRSLLTAFPAEVAAHERGDCAVVPRPPATGSATRTPTEIDLRRRDDTPAPQPP